MSKAFIYGRMVEGDNFTDRIKETRRLKANFEEGINTIVISPQMNLLRAICSGIHDEYTSKAVTDVYNLGTRSNIVRIKTSLAEKEIIDVIKGKAYISDPVFELWFRREYL